MASNTRQSLELLEDANIRSDFWETWEGAVESQWVTLITGGPLPSDKSKEEYSFLNGAPSMSPSTGKIRAARLHANKLEIENIPFDAAVACDIPRWRRDKTGQIRRKMFIELAEKSRDHWAPLLTTLIEAGFSTAGPVDGKNFFAADHLAGGYTGQKNLITVSDYAALGFVSLANPTNAEMANAIFSLIQQTYTFKDDTGRPRNPNAKSFVVMVPVKWMRQAIIVSTETVIRDGASEIVNPLKKAGFSIQVEVNQDLTSANNYIYAFRTATDGSFSPLIRQSESLNGQEVDFKFLGEDSEYATIEGEVVAQVKASRAVGYGDWWRAVAGTCSQV